MKASAIFIISLAILIGAPSVSAQSFKERFKKATEKVGKQILDEVTKDSSSSSKSNSLKSSKSSKSSKKNSKKSKSSKQSKSTKHTTRLPESHTALFAPLGKSVDAAYGTKSVKAVKPPKDEAKQPDWMDARVSAYELDNKSLVDELLLLDKCLKNGYISGNSPASFRYNTLLREFTERVDAVHRMVEYYDVCVYDYNADYGLDADAVNDNNHAQLARILKSRQYHTLVRSSIVPLFSVNADDLDDDTKTYFKKFGGMENAHKQKFTVWDPDSSK